jgi:catechol 2,3-dioxygenase-like lactoylglutathione lyase family enzyme
MTPTPPIPVGASIDQIGLVVRDVQAMAESLQETLGIGPFRLIDWPIEGIDPQSTYHGQPRSYRIRLGFARAGAAQIELVQPLDDQSIWSDFLASHGPGLHHFRITVANFDETVEALQAAGFENIASGTGAHVGSRWAYFDTADLLEGIVIEVRTRLEGSDGEGKWATEGAPIGGT